MSKNGKQSASRCGRDAGARHAVGGSDVVDARGAPLPQLRRTTAKRIGCRSAAVRHRPTPATNAVPVRLSRGGGCVAARAVKKEEAITTTTTMTQSHRDLADETEYKLLRRSLATVSATEERSDEEEHRRESVRRVRGSSSGGIGEFRYRRRSPRANLLDANEGGKSSPLSLWGASTKSRGVASPQSDIPPRAKDGMKPSAASDRQTADDFVDTDEYRGGGGSRAGRWRSDREIALAATKTKTSRRRSPQSVTELETAEAIVPSDSSNAAGVLVSIENFPLAATTAEQHYDLQSGWAQMRHALDEVLLTNDRLLAEESASSTNGKAAVKCKRQNDALDDVLLANDRLLAKEEASSANVKAAVKRKQPDDDVLNKSGETSTLIGENISFVTTDPLDVHDSEISQSDFSTDAAKDNEAKLGSRHIKSMSRRAHWSGLVEMASLLGTSKAQDRSRSKRALSRKGLDSKRSVSFDGTVNVMKRGTHIRGRKAQRDDYCGKCSNIGELPFFSNRVVTCASSAMQRCSNRNRQRRGYGFRSPHFSGDPLAYLDLALIRGSVKSERCLPEEAEGCSLPFDSDKRKCAGPFWCGSPDVVLVEEEGCGISSQTQRCRQHRSLSPKGDSKEPIRREDTASSQISNESSECLKTSEGGDSGAMRFYLKALSSEGGFHFLDVNTASPRRESKPPKFNATSDSDGDQVLGENKCRDAPSGQMRLTDVDHQTAAMKRKFRHGKRRFLTDPRKQKVCDMIEEFSNGRSVFASSTEHKVKPSTRAIEKAAAAQVEAMMMEMSHDPTKRLC